MDREVKITRETQMCHWCLEDGKGYVENMGWK